MSWMGQENTGFCFGSGLTAIAGIVAAFLGVKADRQSLESIAAPLSARPQEAALEPIV